MTSNTSSTTSSSENTEPVTNKWHLWAKEEDKYTTSLSSVESRSPKISHSTKTQVEQRKYFKPNEEQLNIMKVDPPHCFCKKPAHVSYTLEYEPILECSTYGRKTTTEGDKIQLLKNKYTCGFHVHETSWLKLRTTFLSGELIHVDYPELQACPLYNFTFCTIFHVTNSYDKEPPTISPNCFCSKPVILKQVNNANSEYRPGYIFACRNGTVEGVNKCSWKLAANEVAFPRPRNSLHTYVDFNTYQDQLLLCKKKTNVVIEQPKPANNKAQQHQSHLLATLTAYTPTTTQKEEDVVECNSLVMPTSVLSKKQTPPSVSSSTATSTSSALNSPIKIEDLRTQLMTLKRHLEQQRREFDFIQQTLEDEKNQIEYDCKEELLNMSLDLEQECLLRQNCQKRLSQIEIDMVHLMNENERTLEEFINFRESTRSKYGKEEEHNKCKVCFHRSIEYLLIPCYHFAYCQPCAAKLKECAICRRLITGIQKVYTC